MNEADRALLAEEVAALEADQDDRREMLVVAALMGSLRPSLADGPGGSPGA